MKILGLLLLLYFTALSALVSSKVDQCKDVSSLIPESSFNEILKRRNDQYCEGGVYTYASFLEAARSFKGFATTGDINTRKREIAAFFAHTSHQTSEYCSIREGGNHPLIHCNPNPQYPCAPDKRYYGRGPFLLTGNEDYGKAGKAIGVDLLGNPDLVTSDSTIIFKTAVWYWMTPQSQKPSLHDAITRQWKACAPDKEAGRVPGFGLTINILQGYSECGKGASSAWMAESRIKYYKRYCSLLGVSPGANLECSNQQPFPSE